MMPFLQYHIELYCTSVDEVPRTLENVFKYCFYLWESRTMKEISKKSMYFFIKEEIPKRPRRSRKRVTMTWRWWKSRWPITWRRFPSITVLLLFFAYWKWLIAITQSCLWECTRSRTWMLCYVILACRKRPFARIIPRVRFCLLPGQITSVTFES